MTIHIITLLACMLCPLAATPASDYKEMIRNNPETASGEFYHYIYTLTKEKPAPKGYKPFYISHYGRHGSRYHTGPLYFRRTISPLLKADSLGILSAEGQKLLADLQKLSDIHQGHFGMLTERGINEHREIAYRMYKRYPQVFSGKAGRDRIICKSSVAPRCMASMANFMSSLQQHCASNINARMYCSDSIQHIVAPDRDLKDIIAREEIMEDSIRHAEYQSEKFMNRIFTDTQQAHEIISDPIFWMKHILDCGSIVSNLPSGPNIIRYFTQEELEGLWVARNARFYYLLGSSRECPECPHLLADALINDIVENADHAVSQHSRVTADFRFGHDTVVLSLAFLIGLNGMNGHLSAAKVQHLWNCTRQICMASNIQFIFYRNNKDDIIVKCLYNEQEHMIPSLDSPYKCYYSWKDLRKHLMSLPLTTEK